jgi:hypothetical protein
MAGVYRAPGGPLIQVLIAGFAVSMLVAAIRGGAALLFVVFAVVFLGAAVYGAFFRPYKMTLSDAGLVAFHSLLRTRVISVADVRRIRRYVQGAVWIRFTFARGRSLTVPGWPRFVALAEELHRLNPGMDYDGDID